MSNAVEVTGPAPSLVLIELSAGIARLTLNRPEMGNAINLDLARELVSVAIRCDTDPAIRCVVLTGAGRMFCAGGDLGLMTRAGANAAAVLNELAGTLHLAVTRFARMRKPLLVLVNGPAAGAGLSLAILGDIVLAARSSHFTSAYTAVGLTADGGLSWLLPRIIGLRKAQDMMLTNRRVTAVEAESTGLVTRVLDDAELQSEGGLLAARLSRAATAALGSVRALLLGSFAETLETQMEHEVRAMTAAAAHAESIEGIAAFLAKRQPNFLAE